MLKSKVIEIYKLSYKPLLFYIIILTQGIFFLKFIAFPLIAILIGKKVIKEIKITNQVIFYTFIIIYSTFFVFIYSVFDFSIKYLVAAFLGIFIWFLCLINNIITTTIISNIHLKRTKATIDIIFIINAIVSFLQLFILMIEYKAINPFSSEVGMSAGDAITGIFANSSVNMVILSLFFSFYLFKKENFKAVVTIIIILLTTYMSGILIFGAIFSFYFLLISKFSITKKIVLLFSLIALSTLFYFVSKDNVEYVVNISSTVVEDVPPRKLTSFQQTLAFSSSSYSNFFFGNGIGNFSSRLAYIAGGEYVSWYPPYLVRRSHQFNNNHFQLWNYDILSTPFFDGTANQPFSVFNQFLGEYGFIGTIILLYFYFYSLFKQSKKYSFIRLLLVLLFFYMLLDYWFEFFSVIVVFELIVAYWLKEASEKIKHKQIVA